MDLPLEKKFDRVGMGFPTGCADTGCDSVSTGFRGDRFKPSGVPSGEGAFSRFSSSFVCANGKIQFNRKIREKNS